MSRPSRQCYVPGCRTGYKKSRRENARLGVKNKPVFSTKDPKRIALWNAAINRADRPFSKTDVVCELHFKEDEIIKFFETRMPDGVIHRIERCYCRLARNAVPSIFPPPEAFKGIKKKKVPPAEQPPSNISALNGENVDDVDELCPAEQPSLNTSAQNCESQHCFVDDLFNFQVLMKEAHNILLPSDMWTVGVLKGNQVIFANWSDEETVEAKKRVLINMELHVKVYFGNVGVSLDNMTEVHSLMEVAAFLIVIDQLKICPGIKHIASSRSRTCLGYICARNGSNKGNLSALCHHCQNAERDLVRRNGNEKEAMGTKGLRCVLKKASKSSEICDPLHKKKRKLLLEKGDSSEEKASAKGTVIENAVYDDTDLCWVEDRDEVQEWVPEWRSLTSPQHLTIHEVPMVERVKPPFVPARTMECGGEAPSLDVETLVREAHQIPLPSNEWTLGVVKGKCLIFACWREDMDVLEAEKRLVINENMEVKVIFGGVILALDGIRKVHQFEDIGRYLYIVNKMNKCNGLGTGRRAASCPGYFLPGAMGGCLVRCAFCQGARDELNRMRKMRGRFEEVRAEAQGKVWKNLKKLSDLYPEMKKSAKCPLP